MANDADFQSLGFLDREGFEFPKIVNLEVFRGACPCRCVHCPVGTTPREQRAKRFGRKGMELGLYEKIVGEIAVHPSSTLRIHSAGEPLLWENLPTALEIVARRGVRSWIFTSAVTAEEALLDALCDTVRIIEVSVNSTTAGDYAATKGIDAFERVTANIHHMRDRIRAGARARLIVSRVQTPDEAADRAFVEHWMSSGLVDDAFVRTYHTYNDLLADMPRPDPGAGHQACLVHWARFNITVDGYAIVCFNEVFKERLDPALIYGDLHKRSIAKIWHGPRLKALRAAELSGDYSSLGFGEALPCTHCTSCQPLRGDRQTSEHQVSQLSAKSGPAAGGGAPC